MILERNSTCNLNYISWLSQCVLAEPNGKSASQTVPAGGPSPSFRDLKSLSTPSSSLIRTSVLEYSFRRCSLLLFARLNLFYSVGGLARSGRTQTTRSRPPPLFHATNVSHVNESFLTPRFRLQAYTFHNTYHVVERTRLRPPPSNLAPHGLIHTTFCEQK